MECAKCNVLKAEEVLKCASCRVSMHYSCGGLSEKDLNKILPMNKPKWKCVPCKSGPSKSASGKSPPMPPLLIDNTHQPRSIVNIDIDQLKAHFDLSFSTINANIESLRADFTEQLKNLTSTVSLWGTKIVELESEVGALNKKVIKLESDIVQLSEDKEKISEELLFLKRQVDDSEQKSRLCNIEIQNIPESKNENLLHIVGTIGVLLGVPITEDRVRDCHRVAHNNNSTNRPKNIIVQLTSRRLKSEVIAAARIRKNLTLEKLRKATTSLKPGEPTTYASGGDSSQRIYVNEHLTLKNKILFSKVREVAVAKDYKYVWIKNATILLRKNDQSKVIAIRQGDDLEKL
ncbi:uncharacterized protein LOC123721907 [Papilio machaon]|uniref:uncharacterized protein LOC123721907 n=1 Tax=Papilio machaon TaxID=76193 RepID=UPI001E663DC2|nr:uncharacterized protein LOC123721907 [Papilio machaon]